MPPPDESHRLRREGFVVSGGGGAATVPATQRVIQKAPPGGTMGSAGTTAVPTPNVLRFGGAAIGREIVSFGASAHKSLLPNDPSKNKKRRCRSSRGNSNQKEGYNYWNAEMDRQERLGNENVTAYANTVAQKDIADALPQPMPQRNSCAPWCRHRSG